MIAPGSPEQDRLSTPEKQPSTQEAYSLLEVDENPLLLSREKFFLKRLLRDCAISPSSEVSSARIDGISAESKKLLEWMIKSETEGQKKSPGTLLGSMNPPDWGPNLEINKSHIPGFFDYWKMYFLGISGNLDGVIKRVSEKKGNCLEYSVVMQLLLKTYYPNQVPEAQILAFSSFDQSRHFYLQHKLVEDNVEHNFLTLYKAHPRRRTREDALEEIQEGQTGKRADLSAIYTAYVKLLDHSSSKTN